MPLDAAVVNELRNLRTEVKKLGDEHSNLDRKANKANNTIRRGARQSRRSMRSVNKDTKQSALNFGNMGKEVGSALPLVGQMATITGLVAGAVQLGTAEWTNYIDKLRQASEISKTVVTNLGGVAAGGGFTGQSATIRNALSRQAEAGAGPLKFEKVIEGLNAFISVAKDASSEQLIQVAARLQVAGGGGRQDIANIGQFTGALFKAGVTDIGQASNLGALISQAAGKDAAQILEKLRETATKLGPKADIDQITALLLAGAAGGRGGLSKVNTSIDKFVTGGGARRPEALADFVLQAAPFLRPGFEQQLSGVTAGRGSFLERQREKAFEDPILARRLVVASLQAQAEAARFDRDQRVSVEEDFATARADLRAAKSDGGMFSADSVIGGAFTRPGQRALEDERSMLDQATSDLEFRATRDRARSEVKALERIEANSDKSAARGRVTGK